MVAVFGEGGTGYNTSINPAIKAEFAHAVYRFGHSMLTESVDRTSATAPSDDIDLFDAFLNPPSFMAGGRTPDQAAGDVVRGMTRQIGNEIDEFVTEALRNQLLGLPLDLATLNMARARDTGIPSLNAARRSFFAESNNSALAPYQSWADFAFVLKHPKSLNNFIAAYGRHPSITEATTLDRQAGRCRQDPGRPRRSRRHPHGRPGDGVDEIADNGPDGQLRVPQQRAARGDRPGHAARPRWSTPPGSTRRTRRTRASTTSTCGSVASPRSSSSSAVCSARRSTTSSSSRWRTCSSATGSTTCRAPPASTC